MATTELHWLLLLYALPTQRNAERVNLWRKLKKFGAVQLQSSGYLLPNTPPHVERFQWLVNQIRDAGGDATLIRFAKMDGVSNQEIIGMFNQARATDYKQLAAACQGALSRRSKRKSAKPATELAKLRQRFSEIRQIDYFDSPQAHDAQMMLRRLEKAAVGPKGASPAQKLRASDYVGKTWLTRPRPGIDRAGSAWLIRRFIDPKVVFIFDMDLASHPDALPFDMAETGFSHRGEDCTFETLVKTFGIKEPAVRQIAEMVHDADLEDGKFKRCECIGINNVLSGWAKSSMTDAELLTKGMDCFEGLYRSLRK